MAERLPPRAVGCGQRGRPVRHQHDVQLQCFELDRLRGRSMRTGTNGPPPAFA